MDSFELNKLSAALLVALLVAMIASMFGEAVMSPHVKLQKNAYLIPVLEVDTSQPQAAAKPLEPIGAKMSSANVASGEKVFKKCTQCHHIEAGKNGIGPTLFGIIGRAIGTLADYAYSSAMKEKSAQNWDVELLNQFLHNPRQIVKGTKMSFMGLENEQDRIDVIGYLLKAAH